MQGIELAPQLPAQGKDAPIIQALKTSRRLLQQPEQLIHLNHLTFVDLQFAVEFKPVALLANPDLHLAAANLAGQCDLLPLRPGHYDRVTHSLQGEQKLQRLFRVIQRPAPRIFRCRQLQSIDQLRRLHKLFIQVAHCLVRLTLDLDKQRRPPLSRMEGGPLLTQRLVVK